MSLLSMSIGREDPRTSSGASITVLFVGGNETQDRYHHPIETSVGRRFGGRVRIEWFPTGWRSNWPKEAARVEARYGGADVVVLMSYVRTMLGQRLRRSAGQAGLPWVACTGHGRAAIERAVEQAVELVTTPTGRSEPVGR
ncbi:MAG: hypothetical protein JWO37_1815 [Acidimicrobiales bacterium]|jgi:hypothetical protein|nr:hypothetical protein [Acidimicrobiales bacterium]